MHALNLEKVLKKALMLLQMELHERSRPSFIRDIVVHLLSLNAVFSASWACPCWSTTAAEAEKAHINRI